MNIGNHKLLFYTLLLLWSATGHAGDLGYPNRFSSMAESVMDMVDAFSSAYQKRIDERAGNRNPWSMNSFSNPIPMTPGIPGTRGMPGRFPPYPPPPSELDGSWQGQMGTALVINRRLFRLYLDRHTFRQGELILQGKNQMLLRDPKTGMENLFEYAESKGRMVLRSEDGQIMLFRRIRR
ncbi:MAG: hypothetical protein ABW166_21600 [Sedimenticola sp.]